MRATSGGGGRNWDGRRPVERDGGRGELSQQVDLDDVQPMAVGVRVWPLWALGNVVRGI